MWESINGWKTWGGFAVAALGLVICLLNGWPLAPQDIAACLSGIISPETLTGVGIGAAGVGLAHKAAKTQGKAV